MPTPEPIRVFIGWDKREASAYAVCCQSIIENTSMPVEIHPLALNLMERFYTERHVDGSNAFIYSRFLVPYLCGWHGSAVFLDGDMLVRGDLAELWDMRRPDRGVQVVQHDYKTKHPVKYLGAPNEDYARKNWSSVILWNCGYWPNRILTPEFVTGAQGSFLHRFEWLTDEQVAPLPMEWNFIVSEEDPRPDVKLAHFSIGLPAFSGYAEQYCANEWFAARERLLTPRE